MKQNNINIKNIAGMTVKDFIEFTKKGIDTKILFDQYYHDNLKAIEWTNCLMKKYEYENGKIPFILKDNMYIKNEITTSGSKLLKNFKAPFNSTVYDLSIKNNLNICAKANMDEFAMGSHNIFSSYGYVQNPINLQEKMLNLKNLPSKENIISPGGSSGGSAVSVNVGIGLGSLGTDTGGSIRGPAEWSGLASIKPTFGNISRYGIIELSASLDSIGIFAKTIECLKYFVNIFYYEDDRESVNQLMLIQKPIQRKLGSWKHLVKDIITPESYQTILNVENKLKAQGYVIENVNISMDLIKSIGLLYTIICYSDASSALRVYNSLFYNTIQSKHSDIYHQVYNDCRTDGFGLAQVKRRMIIGSMLTTSTYKTYINKAWQIVSLIYIELKHIFNQYDGIIIPLNGITPKLYSLNSNLTENSDVLTTDTFLCIANLCGLPSVSIPINRDEKGIYGIQILGDIGMDMQLLDIAQDIDNIYKFNENFRGKCEIFDKTTNIGEK